MEQPPAAAPVARPRRSLPRRIVVSLGRILVLPALLLGAGCMLIAQPTFQRNSPSAVRVDPARLHGHVRFLSVDCLPRDHLHPEVLEKAAAYIEQQLAAAGAETGRQILDIDGHRYSNVTAVFGRGLGRKLVIGAHYDAVVGTPGADDNASAVAGLVELASLIGAAPPEREIEFVAYTHEEPPHFGTETMGSHVHAAALAKSGEQVAGVIVLEMIGYFNDARGSQSYPIPLLHLFYPSRGNFIAVVGRLDQRRFTKQIKVGMKGATPLPVYSINAPKSLPGIDFSDHRNYWLHDFPAVMVTDTAFYRNHEYHQPGDTHDRLDYDRMAQVVVGVHAALAGL